MISATAASCRSHRYSHHVRHLFNKAEFFIAVNERMGHAQQEIRRDFRYSSHPPLHSAFGLRRFSLQTPSATADNSNNFQKDLQDQNSSIEGAPSSFTVQSVIMELDKVAHFNQGKGGSQNHPKYLWDVDSVRQVVAQYEHCLKHFFQKEHGVDPGDQPVSPVEGTPEMKALLLRPETTERAFRALLRCRTPTEKLSEKVREWERYLGTLGQTPLSDQLSLRLLEANGKAGNIGRAMALLSQRKSQGYEPKFMEFVYAVTAIEASGLYLRKHRNIFLGEKDQPQIDDPTRWLDAILINMNQRNFSLTTSLANRMLNTFASTGKSGKALHFFYRVLRNPVQDDDLLDEGVNTSSSDYPMARFRNKPVKIRLVMRPPPPYEKIPSQVRGKMVRKPGTKLMQLKLDQECDPHWSPSLTAAITFADSLSQGACGHDPIELDVVSYSILIKACVNRGSLWRAMHILDEIMPSSGIEPDVVAYNTLLYGLANVGDAPTIKEYFNKMNAKNIQPTAETVDAIVRGLLNLGDVATAITVVQDCFNQFSVLPPYTTHLKILEVALGRGLVYEAKRHVFVIQQLWKWEPNEYHSEQFCRLMRLTQKNPKLSKEALKKMFGYFGETLDDSTFF